MLIEPNQAYCIAIAGGVHRWKYHLIQITAYNGLEPKRLLSLTRSDDIYTTKSLDGSIWPRTVLQGWAHAQGETAREYHRPLTGHMRQMLIEIKGIAWVEETDLAHLRKKQKEERERLERKQKQEAYNAKLDSALDDLLKDWRNTSIECLNGY